MIEKLKKYVSNYDINNDKIKSKLEHSIRVMELSENYAKILKFNEEDIILASQIGLLHDIGRFEQVKLNNTFNDLVSLDHADLGVKILFEDNVINEFNIKNNHEIIKKAIRNHNKYEIEPNLTERELLHARLIRDIDKIDILYNAAYLNYIDLTTTIEGVSSLVLEDIRNKTTVNNVNKKTNNDQIAFFMAFAFDVYYDECLIEMKKYIEIIYEKLEHKQNFKEIYDIVINYINERTR